MKRFARKSVLLLIILSHPGTVKAQPDFYEVDFAAVDSFVLSVKYEQDYLKLAHDLTANYPQDIYKLRAIVKWICNNIAFDYRFINSEKEIQPPECGNDYDCNEVTQAWENNYIKRILRTRRAVADGYSRLLQKLCEISHIQSEIIPGYLRTKPYQIGNKISVNHSWNAVYLDTAWFFVDVTLTAGYCIESEETGKLLKFVKDFRKYYWLSSFARFSRTHFPKNSYWGEQNNMTAAIFFNRPHYYSAEILENISQESPMEGMLSVKKNDTLHFSFNYKKEIRFIQVNSNNFRNPPLWTSVPVSKKKTKLVRDTWAEKKQQYIPFKKQGDRYSFDYVAKDLSLYYLELVFDYKKAIRYKISILK